MTLTNKRGKTLEEYIISKSLYLINERSDGTRFHNRRGKNNIDLTIVNNPLLKATRDWEIWDEESCSDHRIIQFNIRQCNKPKRQHNYHGTRYIISEQKFDRFDNNLKELVGTKFQMDNIKDLSSLDNKLATHVKTSRNVEAAVDTLQEAITMSCNKTFKTVASEQKVTDHKSVTWWTQELTTKRKILNVMRRRFQRTHNSELRESRKNTYHEERSNYQAAIKREKLKSWKEYCNLTPSSNPWDAVYRLASNKNRKSSTMTTILKPDGSYTSNLNETTQAVLEHLITKDDQTEDTEHHKIIRKQIKEPIKTADDRELTPAEVKSAIENLTKRHQGKTELQEQYTRESSSFFPH
jgi:hypothetical protein